MKNLEKINPERMRYLRAKAITDDMLESAQRLVGMLEKPEHGWDFWNEDLNACLLGLVHKHQRLKELGLSIVPEFPGRS